MSELTGKAGLIMNTRGNDPIIVLKDVKKIYRMGTEEVRALDGVTVSIDPGEYVAIMGPSGSGKSTMMNIVGCLDIPSEGTYFLNSNLVSEMDDDELAAARNKEIGFIFQTFNLLPRINCLHNVELPLIYSGIPRSRRRELANEALQNVGLGHRTDHKPTELSGGERQRVAISRALVNKPSILLADDPTGNLDTKTGEEIMRLFEELNRKGNTLLVVTHEEYIARHARRIIRLRDGLIESDEYVADPALARQEIQNTSSSEVPL